MAASGGSSALHHFPYPSRRMPVLARNVVATSQPLAVQAGLRMLLKGGNAVDAALGAAIALTVVEPTSNGIGSDAFAMVWDGEQLHGINGSGRSPAALDPGRFEGMAEMPMYGWDPVTVPGAVDLWVRMSTAFGRLPFGDLFEPAIEYSRDGFMVSPVTAARWADAAVVYKGFREFERTFLPNGSAPAAGQFFRCPDQGRTLAEIAGTGGASFYRGPLADRIVEHAKKTGGCMAAADLAFHESQWVTPLSREYRGVALHEIPPNGQGIAALIALGILRRFDLSGYPPDSADSLHLQIEAMKTAFAMARQCVGDPAFMRHTPEQLLDEDRLEAAAKAIRMEKAGEPACEIPPEMGTVYLTAADADGWMVSFIQSNFAGFGSGIVIPGTGISLQNRGHGFTLEKEHPNMVAGGKRPYHTIIPGFVTSSGMPVMSFGVMGGHMQPQGHVQMMVRIFDYGQNPQAAADAPRWHVCKDLSVALEPGGFAPSVIEALKRRGHRVMVGNPDWGYGGAQLILRMGDGYCAASDPRKDGQAAGY
jgi:gamma-glutamyltranspeptidase/glutathione hydrolase